MSATQIRLGIRGAEAGVEAARPVSPTSRVRSGPGRGRPWVGLLLSSPAAIGCFAFLCGVVLVALSVPRLGLIDPEYVDPVNRLQGPSADHWFGTDDLGRDIFSRVVHGSRVSLLVGAAVTVVAALVGSVLGLVAGYYDRLDGVIMRVMDGLMAFPGLLLAIAIVVSLGPHAGNVILALALVYTPIVARLLRGTTLVIRRLPYVESARCIGLPDRTILRRYIVANAVSPLVVQCTFIIAYAMLAEASLSYLGASVSPEPPTWGGTLRDGQRLLSRAWWIGVFPGVALFCTVLALIVCGEALRDAMDPRGKGRSSPRRYAPTPAPAARPTPSRPPPTRGRSISQNWERGVGELALPLSFLHQPRPLFASIPGRGRRGRGGGRRSPARWDRCGR